MRIFIFSNNKKGLIYKLILNWRSAVGSMDHHSYLVEIAIDYLNLNLAVHSIFLAKIILYHSQYLGSKFGPLY